MHLLPIGTACSLNTEAQNLMLAVLSKTKITSKQKAMLVEQFGKAVEHAALDVLVTKAIMR